VISRRVLLGGVAGFGAVMLAACTNEKVPTTTATTAVPSAEGDLAIAALAASLENLAVSTYQRGLDAGRAGKLGKVPPAVVTFVETSQRQHVDHAAAWNVVLKGAGRPGITGVDLTIKEGVVDPAFAKVNDVPSLAKLVLELENSAAATYQNAIELLEGKQVIKTAASIQPVEMQHAAILNFILGSYPVPDAISRVDLARSPQDKIG